MLDLRSVVFNLFALAHFSHVTYPLPTTTTTTTTATPPVQVEIGEPSFTAFSDPCKSCERFLAPYLEPMRQHNMTAMAGAMDHVCNTAVPAVEQCKIDTGLARCLPDRASPRVPTFNFFCRHKTVIQASTDCWASGYTESLQDCLAVFISEGPPWAPARPSATWSPVSAAGCSRSPVLTPGHLLHQRLLDLRRPLRVPGPC